MTDHLSEHRLTDAGERSPDSAALIELYGKYDPSGEIVLRYRKPAEESFLPIAKGHFKNVCRLTFRSGWLWAASGISVLIALPFLEALFVWLAKVPAHSVRHVLHGLRHHGHAALSQPVMPINSSADAGSAAPHVLHHFGHGGTIFSSGDTFFALFTAFLAGAALLIPLLIVARLLVSAIYTMAMVINLYLSYGKRCLREMQAPTHVSLSKASMKLMWVGGLFSQYGAMLAWQDILALDFAFAKEPLSTPRVIIKYKLPDGEALLPFSLSGFGTAQEAVLFMETANRYVSEDKTTKSFQEAFEQRQELAKLAQRDALEVILDQSDQREDTTLDELPGGDTAQSDAPSVHLSDRQVQDDRQHAKSLLESLSAVESDCADATIKLKEPAQKEPLLAEGNR